MFSNHVIVIKKEQSDQGLAIVSASFIAIGLNRIVQILG